MALEFVVMIGLPKSGKSTWVDANLPEHQLICADDIRLGMGVQYLQEIEGLVWAYHDIMIKAHMNRCRSIVIDATNTTDRTIKKYKRIADEDGYKFRMIHLPTPVSVCLERNVGESAVPQEVIIRMSKQLTRLFDDSYMISIASHLEIVR